MNTQELSRYQDLAIQYASEFGIKIIAAILFWVIGRWLIGVANYDPDAEDRDFPRWPMHVEAQDYRNGFQPARQRTKGMAFMEMLR